VEDVAYIPVEEILDIQVFDEGLSDTPQERANTHEVRK
jgi:hypothetical protein